jgi:hypothetical protein
MAEPDATAVITGSGSGIRSEDTGKRLDLDGDRAHKKEKKGKS